ncbi:DUF3278 domain-containing protein [Terribacillus sp. DMT04]|uniref:DUF3278 domain-containing protein n=1 Tax=Terribacillus sp. DMT04 TaxID=2850441 RepID=UPI001C2B8404|nr:DUF3278 domain-containing protein [Terribacillus sp. DMT04]QXE02422.1 DUF3278 domain-containing protein [Terribacillus sp. DMT04]
MKNKILNHFVGVMDDRDEYQQQEIHKELAFSGILLWCLSILVMFVALVVDTVKDSVSFTTVCLFIINMVYAGLMTTRIRKKSLDETDCVTEEEYEERKARLKKSATFMGIFWGGAMLVTMDYIFPFFSNEEVDISWGSIAWVIGGIFFGMTMYSFSKMKLKKHF